MALAGRPGEAAEIEGGRVVREGRPVRRAHDLVVPSAQVAMPVALVVVRPTARRGEEVAARHRPAVDQVEPVHLGGRIEHEELLELPGGEGLLRRPAREEFRPQRGIEKVCGGPPEEAAEGVEVGLGRRLERLGQPGGTAGECLARDERVDGLVVGEGRERNRADEHHETAHLVQVTAGNRARLASAEARPRSRRRARIRRAGRRT